MTTRAKIKEEVRGVYGVRRVVLFELQPPGLIAVHTEGGTLDEVGRAVDEVRPIGIARVITIWPAPLWWRAWCWLRRLVGR